MRKHYSYSIFRPLTVIITLSLLGLGAMSPAMQAAEGVARPGNESNLMLAATDGMDRRQDRREDRQDDRGDRRGVRQDCREEEGVAGKDKRDCKQEGREERNNNDNNND